MIDADAVPTHINTIKPDFNTPRSPPHPRPEGEGREGQGEGREGQGEGREGQGDREEGQGDRE